jgi:fatty acid-binding protein DegV
LVYGGRSSFPQKGGRINAATAIVGSVLGIKPIMHVDDSGRLVPVGKTRGDFNLLRRLKKKWKRPL